MSRLVPTAEMTLGPFFPREFAAGANDLAVGANDPATGAQGEIIEITHRASTRDLFAHGALRAARFVATFDRDFRQVAGVGVVPE